MTLTIGLTSDFICPWCWVAEARLHRAIEQLEPSIEIHQVWYPFELNPDMPEAGMDRKTYRSNKFGSWDYSQQLDAKTIQATQADGIEFRYDLMTFTPNTLKAHRLTWLADKSGKAPEMVRRIFRAYFSEGQDIGDVETLASLAAETGLDAEQAQAYLLSNTGTHAIREFELQAAAQNVRGVPTIRIGKETVSGAQPVEVLVAALQKATHELKANR